MFAVILAQFTEKGSKPKQFSTQKHLAYGKCSNIAKLKNSALLYFCRRYEIWSIEGHDRSKNILTTSNENKIFDILTLVKVMSKFLHFRTNEWAPVRYQYGQDNDWIFGIKIVLSVTALPLMEPPGARLYFFDRRLGGALLERGVLKEVGALLEVMQYFLFLCFESRRLWIFVSFCQLYSRHFTLLQVFIFAFMEVYNLLFGLVALNLKAWHSIRGNTASHLRTTGSKIRESAKKNRMTAEGGRLENEKDHF